MGCDTEDLRLARDRILDHVQVTSNVRLCHTGLGIEWGHNEQLQVELSEQFQRILGILIVNLGKHFINYHKV